MSLTSSNFIFFSLVHFYLISVQKNCKFFPQKFFWFIFIICFLTCFVYKWTVMEKPEKFMDFFSITHKDINLNKLNREIQKKIYIEILAMPFEFLRRWNIQYFEKKIETLWHWKQHNIICFYWNKSRIIDWVIWEVFDIFF